MRTLLLILVLCAPSCVFVVGKSKGQHEKTDFWIFKETEEKPAEAEMAPMRSYWMGIIRRGPQYNEERTEVEAAALQKAHLDRIGEIAGEGKMILAGPFGPQEGAEDPWIGLFLYTVESREEAEALAASDPAVAAGRLRVEIVEWWGVSGITYPGNPLPDAAAIRPEVTD
jgi:uncharacterized protein YciI